MKLTPEMEEWTPEQWADEADIGLIYLIPLIQQAARNKALKEAYQIAETYTDHEGHNVAHWAAVRIHALIDKVCEKWNGYA